MSGDRGSGPGIECPALVFTKRKGIENSEIKEYADILGPVDIEEEDVWVS